MKDLGVSNVIRKDLENIKQVSWNTNNYQQDMLAFIQLAKMDCEVRFNVDDSNKITSVFFIHYQGIEEVRRLPECIVLDAIYKTNSHKMVLLNFVITGTVASKEQPGQLTTVLIAVYWMTKEAEERYAWSCSSSKTLCEEVATMRISNCLVSLSPTMAKLFEMLWALSFLIPKHCSTTFMLNAILRKSSCHVWCPVLKKWICTGVT